MKRGIGPRTRRFIRQLKEFCQAEEGRAQQLARYLKVPPETVYNWWGRHNRFPTLEQALGSIEWRTEIDPDFVHL